MSFSVPEAQLSVHGGKHQTSICPSVCRNFLFLKISYSSSDQLHAKPHKPIYHKYSSRSTEEYFRAIRNPRGPSWTLNGRLIFDIFSPVLMHVMSSDVSEEVLLLFKAILPHWPMIGWVVIFLKLHCMKLQNFTEMLL